MRWIFLTFYLILLFISCQDSGKTQNESVNIWIMSPVRSTDTMAFDNGSNQDVFRSVIGTLISQYQEGQITGVLAERWEISDDFKHWIFYLRPDVTFETGEPITAQDVVRSWSRLAYLFNQKNSHSPFFSKLAHGGQIENINDPLPGIRADGERLIIDLVEPFPNLLDTISFGLYAVVSQDDYDPKTGLWKDPKHITSSSFYKVTLWTEDHISLKLRNDFLPKIRTSSAFETVSFYWGAPNISDFDIVVANSTYNDLKKTHEFKGLVNSLIYFVHVLGWDDGHSSLSQVDVRRALRAKFYERIKQLGYQPTYSFFPLVMKNVCETNDMSLNDSLKEKVNSEKLCIRDRPELYSFTGSRIGKALALATSDMGFEPHFLIAFSQDVQRDLQQPPEKRTLDLAPCSTEILIEDPASDILFMFLSKEGIQLPDTDGRIIQELNKKEFSSQRINELIWDQAVIWPVGHGALGLWIKKNIDLSHLNKALPGLDLAWIGHY